MLCGSKEHREKQFMNYYYSIKGQAQGPVSGEELDRLLAEGVIKPGTPVIEVGGTEWSRYSAVRAGNSPVPPPPADEKESVLTKLMRINSWVDVALDKVLRMPSFVPTDYEGRMKGLSAIAGINGLLTWLGLIVSFAIVGLQLSVGYMFLGLLIGLIYGFVVQYVGYQVFTITNSLLIGQTVTLSSSRFPRMVGILMLLVTLVIIITTLIDVDSFGDILMMLIVALPCVVMVYLCMNAEGLLIEVSPKEVSPGREFNNSLKFLLRAFFAALHLLTPVLVVLASLMIVSLAIDFGSASSEYGMGFGGGFMFEALIASLTTSVALMHLPFITWLALCLTSWILDFYDSIFSLGSKK